LAGEIAEQLQKGGEISFTAVSGEEGFAAGRVATSGDEVESEEE